MDKYIEYKESGVKGIDEIPEHWTVTKLKYVGDSIIGLTYSPDDIVEDSDTGTLVIRSSNIQNNQLSLLDNVYVNKVISDKLTLKNGDIVICSRNGSRNLIGKNIYVDDRVSGNTFGAFMTVFRTGFNSFFKYFFNSQIFTSQAGVFLTSTINQLTVDTLNNFYTALPPDKDEQAQIALFLDHKTAQLDKLISDKEKLIELLNEERTAIINQAVTKGLDPDAPMKDSGIDWLGEIPKHWATKKLKHVADVNSIKKNYDVEKTSNQEVVFLPMEKVSETGEITQDTRRKTSDVSSGFTYFERYDVIVAKITPCFENGKGAFLSDLETDFGYGSTEFHTLRAKPTVNSKFLYYLTKSERFMTVGEAFMTGAAGQKRVPTSFIKNFGIGLPPLEEQLVIVEYIESLQSKINSTSNKILKEIGLLKEYKTALISEVVTGKVDVRHEEIPETEHLTLAS